MNYSGDAMRPTITLTILAALALTACAPLSQECFERQKKVEYVAANADQSLRRGMSLAEVRAILGEPDDRIVYSGAASPETWKYQVYEDCRRHLGISAPTTELIFRHGRLNLWLIYGK
jgi:hypothetical protein